MIDPSLERIVPDELDPQDPFDTATLELHRKRYQFAIDHLDPGRLLDIACGAGYGAYQMISSEKLADSRCTAVDISPAAIAYARSRYAHPFLQFICTDSMKFTDIFLYDGVVSLETIEHLPDPVSFISKLIDLLKPGGMLIVSAPVTLSTDGNPYHLFDFSQRGFRKLFSPYACKEIAHLIQVQPYALKDIFGSRKNRRILPKRGGLWKFYMCHPGVFFSRIRAVMKDGFNNKYLTLALRKF